MVGIFGCLFVAALSAGLSAGLIFLLNMWASALHLRSRLIAASLTSAFLVMAIPIAAVISEQSGSELAIPLIALIVLGLVLAILVCLPAALFVSRRIEKRGLDPNVFD